MEQAPQGSSHGTKPPLDSMVLSGPFQLVHTCKPRLSHHSHTPQAVSTADLPGALSAAAPKKKKNPMQKNNYNTNNPGRLEKPQNTQALTEFYTDSKALFAQTML